LAYLVALLLLFLVGVSTLGRHFIKLRRLAAAKKAETTDPHAKPKEVRLADKMVNQIIDAYVNSPLEVRRFLTMLPASEKSMFLASIRAPALRSYFEGIVGSTAGSDNDFSKSTQEK